MRIKKTVYIVIALLLFISIVVIYKPNNRIEIKDYYLCDENRNRFKSSEAARKSGLLESQYGATYCPEYKMHPSWDLDSDGINDCYKSNSCSKEIDYMSPRLRDN